MMVDDLLLEDFVDRTDEVGTFCEMLGDSKRPVMAIWGPSGIGKTHLIARMIHECANRKVRKARILLRTEDPTDYMAMMRTCRDDLEPETFVPFTQKIREFFTDSAPIQVINNFFGNVDVGKEATVHGEVGSMIGIQQNIAVDPMTSEPRRDLGVSETERRIRLTSAFLDCLLTASQAGMIVIFIDGLDKAPNIERWLWEDFIDGVRQRKADVRFVITAEKKPKPPEYSRERLIRWAELKPLTDEHVGDLLTKHGCPPDKLKDQIKSAMASSDLMNKGNGEGYAIYIAMYAAKMEMKGW